MPYEFRINTEQYSFNRIRNVIDVQAAFTSVLMCVFHCLIVTSVRVSATYCVSLICPTIGMPYTFALAILIWNR